MLMTHTHIMKHALAMNDLPIQGMMFMLYTWIELYPPPLDFKLYTHTSTHS